MTLSIPSIQQQTEAVLRRFLSAHADSNAHAPLLHDAMCYSALNPGKRLRPVLVYTVGRCLGLPEPVLDPLACAVELMHCYSLIHDDLPAMDDDAMRRGKPSTHIEYDEATAILAGDALLTLSFEVLAQTPNAPVDQLVLCLARACGHHGMAAGQLSDLQAEGVSVSAETLTRIHQLKTGALMRACFALPLCCAHDCHDAVKSSLLQIATHLGTGFQIQDDILDVEATTEQLGKPQGSDQDKAKATYPSIHGLDTAKRLLREEKTSVTQLIDTLPAQFAPLHSLTDWVLSYTHEAVTTD